MQKSFYLFLITSFILSIIWIPPTFAKKHSDKKTDKKVVEEEAVVEVEEVTVTATRAEKEPFKTPNAITVLNLKELERSNVEHASNLLRDSVGVIAQETTVGQGSPMLRSLTGYQSSIHIDWVRLNNSTFRSGPNQYTATIAPEMLERAEVLLGSSFHALWQRRDGWCCEFLYESGPPQSSAGNPEYTATTSCSLLDCHTGKTRSVRSIREPRTIWIPCGWWCAGLWRCNAWQWI